MAVLRSLTTTLGLNSAQFRSELRRSQQSFGTFGRALADGTKTTAKALGGMTSAVVSVKGALTALGTGAALYGIKSAYENADEIRRQAEMIGVSANQWSRYGHAARVAGTDADNLSDVFKDLNVKITDAAKAGSGPMVDFFTQINGSAKEWAALSPDEQFRRFADELSRMSATDARFYLDEINDSAVGLFETLRNGDFLRLADEAEQLGLSLTAGQFDLIREARDEFSTLASTGVSVWQQMLAAAAPVMTEVSRGIRLWINDQAEAAGGFRQLGLVITDSVLTSVVQVAQATEGVLNATYQGAERLAQMVGETLDPEKAALTEQLKALQGEYRHLNLLINGTSPALKGQVVQPEQVARLSELSEKIQEVKTELASNAPVFDFADDLEQQVSDVIARVKAAQAEMTATGTGGPISMGAVVLDAGSDGSDKEAERIQTRLDALRDSYKTEEDLLYDKVNNELTILQEAEEAKLLSEQEYQELRREAWLNYWNSVDQAAEDSTKKQVEAQANADATLQQMKMQVMNQTVGLIKTTAEEGSAVWMAALVAEKGIAIAQAIIHSEVAAMRALAELGPIAGPPMAAKMKAMGYVSAGIIAAQGVAEVAGARALGGEVLAGSTYLVGERGPELFTPGATGQITSNTNLSSALRGNDPGNKPQAITLAPQIMVESGASQSGDEFLAENIADRVFDMLMQDAHTGGAFSRALGVR